jgi:tRNA(Ile)-lysidine synthase TilS/MesJ
MNQTISTVQNFLKTVSLQPGGKILAAVSGGADSVAMLHILCRLAAAEGGELFVIPAKAGIQQCNTADSSGRTIPLSQSKIDNHQSSIPILCAHINHQLRDKESDADEQFTAKLCDKLNVPFFAERIDVKAYAAQKKRSIETAARQLRLDALVRIARRTGCRYIATAHHKDDQAETVLFRLLRGTDRKSVV